MIKKLFEDIELKEILGFVLICFFFAFYFYYNPLTIKDSELKVVNITLSENPTFSPATTELTATLELIDNSFEKPFLLKNCSLYLVDNMDLLNLEIGEKIRIKAKTNELNSGETFINNYISIYDIELLNGEKILELENYNDCKMKSYKKFYWIGIIFVIFLIGGLIKKNRNKPNVG